MESAHPGSSPRLDAGARIFSGFILGFNRVMLSIVGDMLVYSETPMVTSSISRFTGLTRLFGRANRGRLCVRVFIWMSSGGAWSQSQGGGQVSTYKLLLFFDIFWNTSRIV